ncbi:MAG: hypothetical protein B6I34_01705 [Anaerolineaceae bacterium 4572_32.1]|nr:MAG: hypothetical protein B6I34_01705 [Anaerolineaceae bacterium 4572_32.1]
MPTCSLEGRVLVVDDEENVRLLLQRGLARLEPSLQVRVANSSVQALEFLRDEFFDLVVTDYQMPGMNGLELVEAIHQSYPNTKVVLMTAYPSAQVTEQVDRLALDAYILKPFSTRHLQEIIHDLLALPGLSFFTPGGNGRDHRKVQNTGC